MIYKEKKSLGEMVIGFFLAAIAIQVGIEIIRPYVGWILLVFLVLVIGGFMLRRSREW